MLHVNLAFVVFLFFLHKLHVQYMQIYKVLMHCTCKSCREPKKIAKVGFTRSTTQTEIWRILGYFPFWPIICLIREFMTIIAAVGSIFFKKKALSQILVFHPYSMIVSCLFCSSEVWCLQKLRNQWIITGLAKVINFLGAYLGFYQIIINK